MVLTTTTKKQQPTNEWRQRQRTTTAGKRQGVVVEAEEQLLCGSRGFMVRSWRLEIEDRWGGQAGRGVHYYFFLVGVESYLQSYPLQSHHKEGVIFGFLDPIFATIQGRIGKGRIGGLSLEFFDCPTSNLTLNPTPILPKKLLRLWALSSSLGRAKNSRYQHYLVPVKIIIV